MRCAVAPTARGEIGRGFGFGPGRTSSVLRLHEGIDFIARRGDKVSCAWGGVVDLVASTDVTRGPLDGYGNALVVRTEVPGMGTVWMLYAHLDRPPPWRPGQAIATGQAVGYAGNTTNGKYPGMGAHLHHVTSTQPWPKGYGRGSFDPVAAYAQLGLRFVPRAGGQRAKMVSAGPCYYAEGLGSLERRSAVLRAAVPVIGDEEYEPPPEAFTEEYEVSDIQRIGPMLLGLGALGIGVLLVGSVVGDLSTRRRP